MVHIFAKGERREANRPNGLSRSLTKVTKGVVLARNAGVGLTIWNFLRQTQRVGCRLGGMAGLEFFPFGRFEHRMDDTGEDRTWLEGAADAGGDTGSSKSPALKPEPRKWSKPPAKHFDPNGRM